MNPTQPTKVSFAQAEYEKKKKRTRREVFLEKMEQVMPWTRLMDVVEPHYPKSSMRGRPPIGLERMLRMYFVQQWYGLADEAVEDAVYDSQALRNFMGIDLSRQRVPDSTTQMGFRHLLEANDLTKAMLVEVNVMLMERGRLMTKGTLVDARIIPRFSCLRLSPQRAGASAGPATRRPHLYGRPARTAQKSRQ